MKTVGEETVYMKCQPPNERTNERSNDRHRPMAIALGDFVTWAKKPMDGSTVIDFQNPF